jgi:hypothetical protein
MTNDFPEIWQSQSTTGRKMPREEFLRRLERSRARGWRRHYTVLAILLLGLGSSIASSFLWGSHPRIVLWSVAFEVLAFAFYCWYLPTDIWWMRSESPMVDRSPITLNLDGRATPCLDFYRQELKAHHTTVKYGRSVVLGSAIVGLFLILIAWMFRDIAVHPALLTVGLVLAIGGTLRYLYFVREYPKVGAEFQDAETFWPEEKP